MKVRVGNHPGLVKDTRSGAIINTNKEEMQAAKTRKANRLREAQRLDQLENDISELKGLLKEIVGKLQ